MPPDSDRRIAARLDKVFSIYITGAWGTAFGIARNISEGGMFIETPDPYPLGSRMQITFSFPGSEAEMTALGEVVHLCFLAETPAGGPRRVVVGMGVRFMGFAEESSAQAVPACSAALQ
jgi:uncharacterized protein (TIGR02266 family)